MARFMYREAAPREDGTVFTLVHLIGLDADIRLSLAHYHELVAELRKTFPQARDENIYLSKIVHTGSFFDDRAVIMWTTYLPLDPGQSFPDYRIIEVKDKNLKMEYKTRE